MRLLSETHNRNEVNLYQLTILFLGAHAPNAAINDGICDDGQGHNIRFMTIDLTASASEIRAELPRVPSWNRLRFFFWAEKVGNSLM